jgi:C_GCAxxG_C_C family probable redox protein
MASDKFEQAKADAMKGYLDPGPKHLNCAQTALRCGLLAMDQNPELTGAAGYLGGGMARMGQVCGALSGAAVALGLRDQFDTKTEASKDINTFDWMQGLTRRFEAEFGSTTCAGLLGCDISSAEGFRQAKKSKATQRCPEFVGWTCDRMAEILDGE